MTPAELAAELSVDQKTLRRWLRVQFPRSTDAAGRSWLLTQEHASAARRYWGARHASGTTSPAVPPPPQSITRRGPSTDCAADNGYRVVACDPKDVWRKLMAAPAPLISYTAYSEKPGIYGFFFLGKQLPVSIAATSVSPGSLIYVGKTESSQVERDLKQHLANGETGRSTLRRSLAALLRETLALKPMPRSTTETSDRKYTNFKLDDASEQRLTQWMMTNLGVSYWECVVSLDQLELVEAEVIHLSKPLLNLKENTRSPWAKELARLRKVCAELARRNDRASD